MMNCYRKGLELFVGLALFTGVSFAQTTKQSHPINLTTGTIFLEKNLTGPIDWNHTQEEVLEGKIFRIIQFDQLPSEAQKIALSAEGIEVFEYLPKNAFVASIPISALPISLVNQGVVAVHPLPNQMKITPRLIERPLPSFAVNGQKVKVQLIVPPSVSLSFAKEQLASYNFRLELSKPHVNVLVGEVSISSVENLANEPWVRYVDVAPEPGEKESDDGRNLHRSNSIDLDGYLGRQYDGDGISVAVNDDGSVGPHIDFTGRVDQSNITSELGTHGDMVAGIVGGAGNLNPIMRGMAPACFMHIRQYNSNLPGTVPLFLSQDVLIFSSSYSNGCNAGYTALTRTVDQEIYDNPNLIQVFSAGNSNNNDCGYGAGNQWGNITGGHKMGKNVIATANLDSQDQLRNSSSRGPANDGRIKPDISAHGHNQMSTDPNNTYTPGGGTSAAAPGITGCMTQLHQAYREAFGVTAPSALLKAIVLNTANDLGNVGPDFSFGFGKVNNLKAIKVIEDGRWEIHQVSQGGTNTHTFTVPTNTTLAKVMVYWHDKEASTSAVTALVNNLDASISDGTNTYLPYILDPTPNPATLDDPATFGVDSLNNVEQIAITNPTAGTYTLTVNGTGVPFGPQEYVIVYEYVSDAPEVTFPIGGEGLEAGTGERIHWDANVTSGTFTVEYSTDNGSNWNTISTANANARFVNWVVPNTVTGQAKVRVTHSSGASDESDYTFSIIGVPQNLQVDYACPDTIAISWSDVTGATAYDVFVLGTEFMDSVMTVTSSQAFLTGYPPTNDMWISVRARTNEAVGRRAIAINKPPGNINCIVANDLALDVLLNPNGTYPLCQVTGTTLPVEVVIENVGTNPISNPSVNYSAHGSGVVTENITATLAPGDTIHHLFQTGVNLTSGITNFETWITTVGDANSYNDTITEVIYIETSVSAQTYPYSEDFETFTNCATATNCEQTSCNLSNGWANVDNVLGDDIDWRTHNGGTASNNTGPTADALPGTSSGKYLYLEASGNCIFREAQLLSPCISLASAVAPELKFSYHMFGFSMGELHVDILADGVWYTDVILPIQGDQGTEWIERSVNLTQFVGQTINVRFRGITGNDYASDMAIDAFSVKEVTDAPVVDFEASPVQTCLNETVEMFDLSANAPNQYSWQITPSTFTYVAGTNANSVQPKVQFTQTGDYTVKLVASNPIGTDSITKVNYITVTTGSPLPFENDFESAPFPGVDFEIINPDGAATWVEIANLTGASGTPTRAAYMGHFNYNAAGQEDILQSSKIDLTNVNGAILQFDVAHAQYSSSSEDGLIVRISDDCGITYTNEVYNRSGASLATANPTTSFFQPQSANDWRTETVDIGAYTGTTIQIQFISVAGYGNNIFLDNINVTDNSVSAAIINADTMVCVGEPTIISDASQGPGLSYNWTFQDGTPSTANTEGPHSVIFSSIGTKTIDLTVSGPNGTDATSMSVEVVDVPVADFSSTYNSSTGIVDFQFTGQFGQSVTWDFGDGTTASGFNVSHTYSESRGYNVTMIVSNPCNADTLQREVFNWPTSTNDVSSTSSSLVVYPNPFNGNVKVRATGWQDQVSIQVLDVSGKLLFETTSNGDALEQTVDIDLSRLAMGVYFLKVKDLDQSKITRLIKN